MIEFVGAAWIAKRLGTTQQNVSQAGKRALLDSYRGDFLLPAGNLEGRPIWEKESAEMWIQLKLGGHGMKVLIVETGMIERLSIIDPNTKVDWVKDFIGNYGAFSDGQFTYNDETGLYHCDQDTYVWWAKVLSDQEALYNRIAVLKDEHGAELIDEIVNRAADCDLEDQAAAINKELDEEFS